MASDLLKAAAIVVLFMALIAPHEAGHFLVAKLCKVRVIEFSIGFGSRLWSTTRAGTLYAIRAIPMGGYVKMGGMAPSDFGEPNGFHSKAPWQRLAILFGGPLANFVVAMLLVTGYFLTQLNSDPGKVGRVDPNGPAYAAGIRAGDVITTVNGQSVQSSDTILAQEQRTKFEPIVIAGHHSDGRTFSYTITPHVDLESNGDVYLIGIGGTRVVTVGTAFEQGVTFPFTATVGIVGGLAELATGEIPGGFLGPQGLTGPVGIGEIATQSVDAGPLQYLEVVALLSIALGVTNLLPLPALDGGRMAVVLVEWIRRRPFDRQAELAFQTAGLLALLVIAAMITLLDIERIATGQFPGLH